jgi:hypothetical protein
MKSRAQQVLRGYADLMDLPVGVDKIHHDYTAWIGAGFDLSAAADHFGGLLVEGYRPGLGGSSGAIDELGEQYGPEVVQWLSEQEPEGLAEAAILAYAYGTACDGRRETIKGYY